MSVLSMSLFVAGVLAVSGGIHVFLYRRLVRGLGIRSAPARWALRAAAVVLAVSYPLARWLDGFAPDPVVRLVHGLAGWWLGFMLHLLWVGLLVWIGGLAWRASGRGPGGDRGKRAWGVGGVALTVVAALVLGLVGSRTARSRATVRRVVVPVKAWTEALGDLVIVLAADLHAGVSVDGAEVERRVAEIMALKPDLVLLPGDILDHPPERMPDLARELAALRAPLGVYATTGNHEYYVGVESSVALLERAGLRVLMNEHVLLPGGLVVSGEEDRTALRMERSIPPRKEILGPEARQVAAIHLNHTPAREAVAEAIEAGADLVVSGHTHGGQIWPFSYLTRMVWPYPHGLYEVGEGHQLTTCGIGWWGPPMRLGTHPEIMVVRLAPGPEKASIDGAVLP